MVPHPAPPPLRPYEGRQFSYARPEDPWLQRVIIRAAERLTGSRQLQKIYDYLHRNNPDPYSIWGETLERLHIQMDYDERQLEKVPKTGPVIFIANHPFGLVDGAMFLHLATRVRPDFFLLINEVLAHEPVLEGHLLPVDFRPGPAAKATNLATRQKTRARLQAGEALVIFPSGGVATAFRWSGPVEEWPWRTFICPQIHSTQCTVVPIFFHGQNSWLFHLVSKINMNLRLGLLIHEALNKRGQTIQAVIGDPIPYAEMAPYKNRQALIGFLQARTMALGQPSGEGK
ncbi:MAG: glycerol acyltransferase [Bacteroidetes bacterium]|nr:MAG: glycerol acyltransferase [Bacteroidota bacterium]PTM12717.1 MAG: glycerol acyltransferase [Bacteroidota bacterium]